MHLESTNGDHSGEVVSTRFVPNHLAKGLFGLVVAVLATAYSSVQLGRHQNELLLDEAERRGLAQPEELS